MKIKRRYRLLIFGLFLVAVNIAIYFYDYRTTFLKQNIYKLDPISTSILKQVDEQLIITLYKSDNLNAFENNFTQKIYNILLAYQQEAKAPIHIEVVNPFENLEVKLEAMNSGIQSIQVKDDDNSLRTIYIGIIIQKGGKTEVLPIVTPRMSIEYLISSSLRKLMETKRRKIGLIQGHGEPSLSYMLQVEKMLLPNYDVTPIMLSQESNLLDYESLLIIAPTYQYNDLELEQLDAFLDAGKNIFIALDRVNYDSEINEGYKIDTRLEDWLMQKGLLVNSDFIIDSAADNVMLQKTGTAISFPYFPQITNFAPHPTTKGINTIVLGYASSIEFMDKAGITFTPLAKTSKVSGKKSLPMSIDFKHKWTQSDYLYPEQTVAAVIEGKLGKSKQKDAKIFVISDGDLVLDTKRSLHNHLFIVNVIDWLSDPYELVSIKQKGVMKKEKNEELHINNFTKYIYLFLPLLIIGGTALFCSYRRKKHIDKLRTRTF